jgi:hypothetical protein
MEGSSKEWKKFSQRDRMAAENFAEAATECGVDRIIYSGGLIHDESREWYSKLSDHMPSRKEVGDILRTSARVTIFRAAGQKRRQQKNEKWYTGGGQVR